MNLIQAFYKTLELKTTDNGTVYLTTENKDSLNLIRDLDCNPAIIDLAQRMAEYDLENLEDCLHEIADGYVDHEYYRLAQWVGENPQVMHEYAGEFNGMELWKIIQQLQFNVYSSIVHRIYSHFEDEIAEYLENKQ